MKGEKEIMYDSPEAATFKTGISGWVSSDGRFWGNGKDAEHMARYSGCTHHIAPCGHKAIIGWSLCDDCRSKKQQENYLKLPLIEWDGVTPLCLYNEDKYFFDEDDIVMYCEDSEIPSTDLQLCICTPNKYTEVDVDAIAPEDVSPEDYDGDLPKVIQDALDALNKVIREYPKPFTWSQGKQRVIVVIDNDEPTN